MEAAQPAKALERTYDMDGHYTRSPDNVAQTAL